MKILVGDWNSKIVLLVLVGYQLSRLGGLLKRKGGGMEQHLAVRGRDSE